MREQSKINLSGLLWLFFIAFLASLAKAEIKVVSRRGHTMPHSLTTHTLTTEPQQGFPVPPESLSQPTVAQESRPLFGLGVSQETIGNLDSTKLPPLDFMAMSVPSGNGTLLINEGSLNILLAQSGKRILQVIGLSGQTDIAVLVDQLKGVIQKAAGNITGINVDINGLTSEQLRVLGQAIKLVGVDYQLEGTCVELDALKALNSTGQLMLSTSRQTIPGERYTGSADAEAAHACLAASAIAAVSINAHTDCVEVPQGEPVCDAFGKPILASCLPQPISAVAEHVQCNSTDSMHKTGLMFAPFANAILSAPSAVYLLTLLANSTRANVMINVGDQDLSADVYGLIAQMNKEFDTLFPVAIPSPRPQAPKKEFNRDWLFLLLAIPAVPVLLHELYVLLTIKKSRLPHALDLCSAYYNGNITEDSKLKNLRVTRTTHFFGKFPAAQTDKKHTDVAEAYRVFYQMPATPSSPVVKKKLESLQKMLDERPVVDWEKVPYLQRSLLSYLFCCCKPNKGSESQPLIDDAPIFLSERELPHRRSYGYRG